MQGGVNHSQKQNAQRKARTGAAALLVLLVLALLPHVTAGNHVDPVFIDYSAQCSDLAPAGTVWHELEVEPVRDGEYASGQLSVQLGVNDDGDAEVIDWSSNIGIDGVFVKGGPGGNFYRYEPPATGDGGLTTPLNPGSGKHYNPGYVLFCTATPLTVSTATPSATPVLTPTPTLAATLTPMPTPTASPMPQPPHRIYFPRICINCSAVSDEPNDTCRSAHPIAPDMTYHFYPNDLHDWYRFNLEHPAEVEVRVGDFVPLEGQVAAYIGDSCESADLLKNIGKPSLEKILFLGQQPAGTFFLYVSNDGAFNDADPYSLIVETQTDGN